MFLPDSFPILPVRLVLAQWKQDCPFCERNNYNPILALRYVSGRLFITLKTDSVRHLLYEQNEEIRGRWLDFRFEVIFRVNKQVSALKRQLNIPQTLVAILRNSQTNKTYGRTRSY